MRRFHSVLAQAKRGLNVLDAVATLDDLRTNPRGKASTLLRRATPRLQAIQYAPVRYTLKCQADHWRRFFRGDAGRPRFKRRGRDSVTVPQDVRIRDGKLYPDAESVPAVLKRVKGKWMATMRYAVAVPARPDDGTVTGVDMNVGQVAVGDGRRARIVHAPAATCAFDGR